MCSTAFENDKQGKKKQQAENGHLKFASVKEQLKQSLRIKISRRFGVTIGGIINSGQKKISYDKT